MAGRFLWIKQGLNKKIFQVPLRMFRKKRYEKEKISIIASNCVGGVLYHDYGMPFLSPTINLFFEDDGFLKFAANFKEYMELDLTEDTSCKEAYPVGVLGDIKIHFLHYRSFQEAKDKWTERSGRIDYDRIIFVFVARRELTERQWKSYGNLNAPRLMINFQEGPEERFVLRIPQKYRDMLFHFVGITGKRYYEKYFGMELLMELLNGD